MQLFKTEYEGVCFLVDSWLQNVGSITSFVEPGTFKNPTVPLPMPVDEVLSGVDCYVITHVNSDHLDLEFESLENMTFAAHVLGKAITVVAQGEEDAAFMREAGFRSVIQLDDKLDLNGVELVHTPTLHPNRDDSGRVSSASPCVEFYRSEYTTSRDGNGASAEIRHGELRDRRQTNGSRTRSDKRDGVRHRLPPQKRPNYEAGVGRFVSRSPNFQMCTNIGGPCQKMHPRERGATSVAAAVADARRSHHPDEAAKAHLNSSS